MRVRAVVAGVLAVVTGGFVALAPSGAGAVDRWVAVASWELNEPAGASTLMDSSGNGFHASVGSAIDLGVRDGSSTVQRFPYISVTAPAVPAARLHILADRPGLDPGGQGFAVEVRFRTHAGNRNILQKGQSRTSGGYWKVEISGGVATCVFRGATGSIGMKSRSSVEDSRWHVVRCTRSSGGAELYLDGARQARSSTNAGLIDNSWELAIGGKPRCNNTTVSCDYFHGDLDYVRIERLQGDPPTTTTTVPPTTTTTVPPTTTTTVPPIAAPASRLPVGQIDSVTVAGSTITVKGKGSDPDGTAIARIVDVVDGRRSVWDQWAVGGRFGWSFQAAPGTHQVCVSLLDSPTLQAVPIGCREAVVK